MPSTRTLAGTQLPAGPGILQRVVEAALLEPEDLDRIDQEIKSHIDQVTVEAKAAAMPTEKDLLTDVYVAY